MESPLAPLRLQLAPLSVLVVLLLSAPELGDTAAIAAGLALVALR